MQDLTPRGRGKSGNSSRDSLREMAERRASIQAARSCPRRRAAFKYFLSRAGGLMLTLRYPLQFEEATMPMYDYHCAANDQTVQVTHRMSEEIKTWGEVCAMVQRELGDTPPDAPVAKVLLGANVVRRKALGSDSAGGSAYGAMTTTKHYHTTKNFD